MNVLSIGSDLNLFKKDSDVSKRVIKYGELVDKYYVINFTKKGFEKTKLSEKVTIFPTNSFNKLFYIKDAIKIGKELIKKEKFNVITTQDPFESALVGTKLKKIFKLGLNIQIHGDFFSNEYYKKLSLLYKLRLRLAKNNLKQADSIRVVSKRIANSLNKFNISQDKIIIAPIYVDWQRYGETGSNKLRQRFFDKFVILSVGRLVKDKNLELLINAFSEVNKKYSNSILLIVGSGEEEITLKALTESLGLIGKVIFEGWQDNLADYYNLANVFTVTSSCEGYNRTVIEAMAAGCPVVMTDVGLAGEIVKQGENGFIIHSKEELVEAIEKLINDEDLQQKFSAQGLETVIELNSEKEILDLYKLSWSKAID